MRVAAYDGHVDEVSLLLNHPGVDVKKIWRGTTALHLAASHGHVDAVALLLSHASNMLTSIVNIADDRGLTALHDAVLEGHTETVSILLEQPEIDVSGQLLLHHAVEKSHAAVVALLLNCPRIDVNEKDDWGETALHYAMHPFYGHPDPDILRRMLINPDIDPNVKSFSGFTPIIMLLLDSRLLLERNNNIDIQRDCLQAMVESSRVDLEVKHPWGLGLEDLAW